MQNYNISTSIFYVECSTVISTQRTRQDSDKWFFHVKPWKKIYGRKVFLAFQVDHLYRNQSWNLLEITEKHDLLRITGEPVITEKKILQYFKFGQDLDEKPFVVIQSGSLKRDTS